MVSANDDTAIDQIDQTWSDRFLAKGRDSPFVMASLVTLAGICSYGAYAFKSRKLPTQMYLIQLRVIAQGATVGCITMGMIYHMVKRHFLDKKDKP